MIDVKKRIKNIFCRDSDDRADVDVVNEIESIKSGIRVSSEQTIRRLSEVQSNLSK